MNKQTFFTILYVGLIIGVIAFLIFLVVWLQGESAICMKDPINYYANKTAQMCYCNDGINGMFAPRG